MKLDQLLQRSILPILVMTTAYAPLAVSVETNSKSQKDQKEHSAPQNVGGLLFDFDEGVEIEKGAGGSVNIKSNRDYLKSKFREINSRFDELESRMTQIEKRLPQPVPSPKESSDKENTPSARVLSS